MGAPSVYFVFAVPQDGITAPADFNASVSGYLRSLWNGTATGTGAGTLTGPDASGYYTATLTGVTIPDNAVMLTGGLGYSYNVTTTLPLTQTNLADYPVSKPATATGLTPGSAQQDRRSDRRRTQRAEGCDRLHRPPGDRRRCALQQVPPGTRSVHRRRFPRRTAQRRDDLFVVPHAEPDQQRLVGGFRLASCTRSMRPRNARSSSPGMRPPRRTDSGRSGIRAS